MVFISSRLRPVPWDITNIASWTVASPETPYPSVGMAASDAGRFITSRLSAKCAILLPLVASLTAEDTEKSSMNANIIRETAREPVNFAAPETDIPFLTAADTGTGISFSSEGAGSDGSKATEECPAISLTKPKFSAASEVGFSSGISGSNAICPLCSVPLSTV